MTPLTQLLVQQALCERGEMPKEEVQRLSEFDAKGASLRGEWATVIDDATKRLGGAEDNRCRVTVTDRFGGRGHDFQVLPLTTLATLDRTSPLFPTLHHSRHSRCSHRCHHSGR